MALNVSEGVVEDAAGQTRTTTAIQPEQDSVSADDTSLAAKQAGESQAVLTRDDTPRPPANGPQRHSIGHRLRWAITIEMVVVLLLISGAGALDAYHRYKRLHFLALDGLHHLQVIEGLLPSKHDLPHVFDEAMLDRVEPELSKAEKDFAQLRVALNAPGGTLAVAAVLPWTGSLVATLANLSAAADEACLGGLAGVHLIRQMLVQLKIGEQANGAHHKTAPPIDANLLASLRGEFDSFVTHLAAATRLGQRVNFSALPGGVISSKQQRTITKALASWPSLQTELASVSDWMTVAPQLLGVTSPTSLLVLLMDRSELRSTGGFQGNYAVATIDRGQVQPFDLNDTYQLDQPFSAKHVALPFPPGYPWWPYQSIFGLRDSNLSGDFPTAAREAMSVLKTESGQETQGVVAFTPAAVERVMQIVGNVYVPYYNVLVTPENLEAQIHYHQLHTDLPSPQRKHFTAVLASQLLKMLHGLSSARLIAVLSSATLSLHQKDIQIYFADKRVESLLAANHNDGAITSGPGDGVTIVDANVGGNKGSQFEVSQFQDVVTLNASGDATHSLTVTYNYNVTDPSQLYGPAAYIDYLRVYVPTGGQLNHLDGFNFTYLGPSEIGVSDQPGRQMWGGYVVVSSGSPYTLHFSWTVPHAATRDAKTGHWRYQLAFQHQAGSKQQLSLTIMGPTTKTPIFHISGALDTDKYFDVTY